MKFVITFSVLVLISACGKSLPSLPSSQAPTPDEGPIVILGIQPVATHQMEIQFRAPKAKRVYQMQYCTDLTQSTWTDITEADGGILISTEDNQVLTFTDTKATDAIRFYRVKLLGSA